MLLARYCKLFGLSPAEEMKKDTLNMAINWACYVAYAQSENEEYQKAQEKGQTEALAMGKFIEELKEQASSRG